MTTAQRYRAAVTRKAAGIRQVTMAEALGVPATVLCAWEKGRKAVPHRHAERWMRITEGLARHLQIPEGKG